MEQITTQEAEEEMRLFEQDIAEKMKCLELRLQQEFDYSLKALDENFSQIIHREIVKTPSGTSDIGISPQIGKYDGTSPCDGFMEQFCFVSECNGCDPKTKTEKFINAMVGEADVVVQKHLVEDSSYQSLQSVLRNEFEDVDDPIGRDTIKEVKLGTNLDNIVDTGFSNMVLSAAISELEFKNQIRTDIS